MGRGNGNCNLLKSSCLLASTRLNYHCKQARSKGSFPLRQAVWISLLHMEEPDIICCYLNGILDEESEPLKAEVTDLGSLAQLCFL